MARFRLRIGWLLSSALLALITGPLASATVHYFPPLREVEDIVGDIETATLLPRAPESQDIVIIGITENTLAQLTYRSPVDRGFVADLLTALASAKPRAIFLDLLLDQASEPEKDAALKEAIATLRVPLVVSYVDEVETVGQARQSYLDDFVPPAARGLANLASGGWDGTVRWIPAGRKTASGGYVPNAVRALATKLGVAAPDEEIRIAWRGRPGSGTQPFRMVPAELARTAPSWFKGKILLIGAVLSLEDRHRTPFSVLAANPESLPGIAIVAHAVDQVLSGRTASQGGTADAAAATLAVAFAGAVIGIAIPFLWLRVIAGAALLATIWVGGLLEFEHQAVTLPIVTCSLAAALSLWAAEAVMRQRLERDRRARETITRDA